MHDLDFPVFSSFRSYLKLLRSLYLAALSLHVLYSKKRSLLALVLMRLAAL